MTKLSHLYLTLILVSLAWSLIGDWLASVAKWTGVITGVLIVE